MLTKVISDMVNITFKVYDTMNRTEITDTPGVASLEVMLIHRLKLKLKQLVKQRQME